nr:uncharacterized protein LOC105867941 isoform X2 [Microcebus murinus]
MGHAPDLPLYLPWVSALSPEPGPRPSSFQPAPPPLTGPGGIFQTLRPRAKLPTIPRLPIPNCPPSFMETLSHPCVGGFRGSEHSFARLSAKAASSRQPSLPAGRRGASGKPATGENRLSATPLPPGRVPSLTLDNLTWLHVLALPPTTSRACFRATACQHGHPRVSRGPTGQRDAQVKHAACPRQPFPGRTESHSGLRARGTTLLAQGSEAT